MRDNLENLEKRMRRMTTKKKMVKSRLMTEDKGMQQRMKTRIEMQLQLITLSYKIKFDKRFKDLYVYIIIYMYKWLVLKCALLE